MANAQDVLKVAAGQIGYRESGTNITKYASDFDAKYTDWYNGKKQGAAWCAMFCDWCFIQVFGVEKARTLLNRPKYSLGASCTCTIGYWQQAGQFYKSNPQPGDQIFFGKSTTDASHTGLVEKVANGKVHTIEGNAGDCVARKTYALTDNSIVGYGRAKFETATKPATGTTSQKPAETSQKPAQTTFGKTYGIDIYSGTGKVVFSKVKAAGKSFVIIRAGYGRYISQKDERFEENYKAAKAAGLNVGVFWYSYAQNVSQAEAEADVCLEVIKGKQYEFPIFYDVETQAAFATGKANVSAMVKAFCDKLEKAGYFAGLYCSTYYLNTYITDEVKQRYSLWVAQYNSTCTYTGPGRVDMWQYSETGSVPGIARADTDLDECYYDYPTVIKNAGLNGFKKSAPAAPSEPTVSTIPGDADLDGKVTAADARLILRTAAQLDSLTGQAAKNADVNGDGKITAEDARLALRKAAGLDP